MNTQKDLIAYIKAFDDTFGVKPPEIWMTPDEYQATPMQAKMFAAVHRIPIFIAGIDDIPRTKTRF